MTNSNPSIETLATELQTTVTNFLGECVESGFGDKDLSEQFEVIVNDLIAIIKTSPENMNQSIKDLIASYSATE